MLTLLTTEIQRFCLQDGPGIRTTIFVKGCPLRCPWCHNPETQKTNREFYFHSDKCVCCGKCVEVCPTGTSRITTGPDNKPILTIDRSACISCMKCVQECLSGAREAVGIELTVDDIIREVLSDRLFYENSGGGVTLSGGEPLLYPEISLEIAKRLGNEQIHVAIETSCFAKWGEIQPLLPYTDLFLVDIKSPDQKKHKETVGWPLEPILNNIQKLFESGATVRIHLPIIPGFNDTEEDFRAYINCVRQFDGDSLYGVDILPYHVYGESKYKFLGRGDTYLYKGVKEIPSRDLIPLARGLKEAGINQITIGGLVGIGGEQGKRKQPVGAVNA